MQDSESLNGQLRTDLEAIIAKRGGYERAFNNESSTRYLVETLLLHCIQDFDGLQIQNEVPLDFQGRTIRPDVVLFQQGPDGYVACLRNCGTVHYLIEVKRPEKTRKDNLLD